MSKPLGFHEAKDVKAAVNYTRGLARAGPLILYGQSMGGAAVLKAMSDSNLGVDAIILEGVFDKMLSTVGNRFVAMRVPSFPSAHLLTFWGGMQLGFSGFGHNPVDYAQTVKCPALILHGKEDPRATVEEARNIFSSLSGTKRMELFDDTGHSSCHKADPEQWKEAVYSFLESLDKAKGEP